MTTISPSVQFFLHLAKAQSVLGRRFDSGLNGLSQSDFMILYHLSRAKDGKMRRIDLAEKVGLTASGVTRLLAPMEKVGLVRRERNADDARVSEVSLASGGKTRLENTLEYAELLAEDLTPPGKAKKLEEFSEILMMLGGR